MDVKLVPVSVAEAEKAALLLKGSDAVLRTPLVRLLTHGVTAIYLKLENIQCVGHIETRVF